MKHILTILTVLACTTSWSFAGTGYTPPASSGGVSGDGTGVTDASSFRTTLGLGTAATTNTGTTTGTVPVLGTSGLPAVGGSLLTGITSSQVSGLGTLATQDSPYAADTWTYTWTPADGDPISANGFTAVQSATTASTTVDLLACYSITPSGTSGESLIYKNVGAASSSSWEARVLLWAPSGNTSRYGWMYDSGIGTGDSLYKVVMSATTMPLRINEATPAVPALQYSGRWVMWTLRCYYNLSTTQSCEVYSGRIKLYTFESAVAETAVSAGRLSIGRTLGAIVTAGCLGGIWIRSTGVNESPVEYRERARSF